MRSGTPRTEKCGDLICGKFGCATYGYLAWPASCSPRPQYTQVWLLLGGAQAFPFAVVRSFLHQRVCAGNLYKRAPLEGHANFGASKICQGSGNKCFLSAGQALHTRLPSLWCGVDADRRSPMAVFSLPGWPIFGGPCEGWLAMAPLLAGAAVRPDPHDRSAFSRSCGCLANLAHMHGTYRPFGGVACYSSICLAHGGPCSHIGRSGIPAVRRFRALLLHNGHACAGRIVKPCSRAFVLTFQAWLQKA